jgi:hypothetical protein
MRYVARLFSVVLLVAGPGSAWAAEILKAPDPQRIRESGERSAVARSLPARYVPDGAGAKADADAWEAW